MGRKLSAEDASSLIAEDFVEFGASGKVWFKAEIITAMSQWAPIERIVENFRVRELISREDNMPPIIRAVLADSLTYLEEDALNDLYDQVTRLENAGAGGILIEAGCALGGSAIVIATAKSKSRPLFVYDVFGMIPPPSDRDDEEVHQRYNVIRSGESEGIGGNRYYGYEEDLIDKVADNFRKHNVPPEDNNVYLVKGLFQETLHVEEKVALAHIDGDWYESVMTCLQRIEPKLISGGVMVIDDYDAWSGCRKAVEEYFIDKRSKYEFVRRTRLHIIRK